MVLGIQDIRVIGSFSSEDAPVSVGVVFDCSGSMGDKLKKSREVVAQFVKRANPEDEVFWCSLAMPRT